MFDVAGQSGEEALSKLRLGRRSREERGENSPRAYLKLATMPIMAALSVINFLE